MHRKFSIFLFVTTLFFAFASCTKNTIPDRTQNIIVDTTPAGKPEWYVPQLPALSSTFETFFNPTGVIEIHLAITELEWNGMLHDYDMNMRTEMYRMASCTISGNGVNASLPAIGLRLRGNTSRKRPEAGIGNHLPTNKLVRVHYKLKFNYTFDADESAYGPPAVDIPKNKDYKFQEIMDKVMGMSLKYNNGDPSGIREALSYEMNRKFGVDAVHTTFARLYIKIGNEDDRYIGVYLAFEDVDKTWVQRRNNNQYSALFKCLWQDFGPADLSQPDFDGNLTTGRIGEEITDPSTFAVFNAGHYQYHPAYDMKEDSDATGVDDLNSLITMLTSNPSQTQLKNAIDVQEFIRAMAVNVMVGQADDYWRGGNNYYMYRNPANQNKWTFMPYDNDRTWGINTFGPETSTSSVLHWGDNSGTPCNPVLVNTIFSDPQNISYYKSYLTYMIDNGYFTKDVIQKRINEMQSAISPYTTGYNIDYDVYPFSTDISGILDYVQKRIDMVNKECRTKK